MSFSETEFGSAGPAAGVSAQEGGSIPCRRRRAAEVQPKWCSDGTRPENGCRGSARLGDRLPAGASVLRGLARRR